MNNAYKRRPDDFKRRILATNINSRHDMYNEEFRWLSMIDDHQLGKKYYNLRRWEFNHWTSKPDYSSITKKLSAANRGKRRSIRTEIKPGEHRSMSTEFRKGQSAHNKGQSLDQLIGAERAAITKQMMSAKKIGKSISPATQFVKGCHQGSTNPRARSVITPHGQFSTISEAVKVTGLTIAVIRHKLNSHNHSEWQYITK